MLRRTNQEKGEAEEPTTESPNETGDQNAEGPNETGVQNADDQKELANVSKHFITKIGVPDTSIFVINNNHLRRNHLQVSHSHTYSSLSI